jgi:hypothetical protein
MTTKISVDKLLETLDLIELLEIKAKEIAAEGHDGWGNTMSASAEMLRYYLSLIKLISKKNL